MDNFGGVRIRITGILQGFGWAYMGLIPGLGFLWVYGICGEEVLGFCGSGFRLLGCWGMRVWNKEV